MFKHAVTHDHLMAERSRSKHVRPEGRCWDCTDAAVEGKTRCQTHLESSAAARRRYYPHRIRHLTGGHSGPKHYNWSGGRTLNSKGYVYIWVGRDHPQAQKSGYALEHRLVMAEMVGRALAKDEGVHHKNGIRNDNRPENLELRSRFHGSGGTKHCPTCTCDAHV